MNSIPLFFVQKKLIFYTEKIHIFCVDRMNEEYLHFLKFKKKPSTKTLNRYFKDLELFENYLHKFRDKKNINETTPKDVEEFSNWLKEKEPKRVETSCKSIGIFFEFLNRYDLKAKAVDIMWENRNKPLEPCRILGCHSWTAWFLKQKGIDNVQRMLEYCDTLEKRETLADILECPIEEITELTKLAELTRIPGLKRKRARLFYDSGYDTLEKIANSTIEEIIQKTSEYIEKNNFDGWPPERKEAEEAINIAKYLESRITY
jgi:replicative superfamily II helicase